jgi:hypothetical protein
MDVKPILERHRTTVLHIIAEERSALGLLGSSH